MCVVKLEWSVISPLIALIHDQVVQLKRNGINANTLNSKISVKTKQAILNDLKSDKPTTKLLYITPELASQEYFLDIMVKLSKRNLIGYFVVDEAHWYIFAFLCCSNFFVLIGENN